jgi:hypothetical protein
VAALLKEASDAASRFGTADSTEIALPTSTLASRISSRWMTSWVLWNCATTANSASIRLSAIAALNVALTPRRKRPTLSIWVALRAIGAFLNAGVV